jgi:CheY-like chemotaxis protein
MSTVLVVEDNEAFAYAISRSILAAGHRVVNAPDTLAALDALDAGPVDLVVTDIRMPPGKPHGFAFARMARMRRPQLPIVYMTGYAGSFDLESELAYGPIFDKKDPPEGLLAEIDTLLSAA